MTLPSRRQRPVSPCPAPVDPRIHRQATDTRPAAGRTARTCGAERRAGWIERALGPLRARIEGFDLHARLAMAGEGSVAGSSTRLPTGDSEVVRASARCQCSRVGAVWRAMAKRPRSGCNRAKLVSRSEEHALRSSLRADRIHCAGSSRAAPSQRRLCATRPATDRAVPPAYIFGASARARWCSGFRRRRLPRAPSRRRLGARAVSLSLRCLPL
jgi:hypothetical protein